jgi:hypothetical protein
MALHFINDTFKWLLANNLNGQANKIISFSSFDKNTKKIKIYFFLPIA